MATKPIDGLPRWADTVTADPKRVSTPTSGKKDVGYAGSEKPAAQFLNWFKNATYRWLGWCEESIDDLEAADVLHEGRLTDLETEDTALDQRVDRLEGRGILQHYIVAGSAMQVDPTDTDLVRAGDFITMVSDGNSHTIWIPITVPAFATGASGETEHWSLDRVSVTLDVSNIGTMTSVLTVRKKSLGLDGSVTSDTALGTDSDISDCLQEVAGFAEDLSGASQFVSYYARIVLGGGSVGVDDVTVHQARVTFTRS